MSNIANELKAELDDANTLATQGLDAAASAVNRCPELASMAPGLFLATLYLEGFIATGDRDDGQSFAVHLYKVADQGAELAAGLPDDSDLSRVLVQVARACAAAFSCYAFFVDVVTDVAPEDMN